MNDRDPVVRLMSANALGRIGGPLAQAALVSATRDPDAGVRSTALRTLAQFQTPATQTAILRAAQAEQHPQVQALAAMLARGTGG